MRLRASLLQLVTTSTPHHDHVSRAVRARSCAGKPSCRAEDQRPANLRAFLHAPAQGPTQSPQCITNTESRTATDPEERMHHGAPTSCVPAVKQRVSQGARELIRARHRERNSEPCPWRLIVIGDARQQPHCGDSRAQQPLQMAASTLHRPRLILAQYPIMYIMSFQELCVVRRHRPHIPCCSSTIESTATFATSVHKELR